MYAYLITRYFCQISKSLDLNLIFLVCSIQILTYLTFKGFYVITLSYVRRQHIVLFQCLFDCLFICYLNHCLCSLQVDASCFIILHFTVFCKYTQILGHHKHFYARAIRYTEIEVAACQFFDKLTTVDVRW